MNEASGAHPIGKKTLEQHLEKVTERFNNIREPGEMHREKLHDIFTKIGERKDRMDKPAADTMDVLETGFELYYEMTNELGVRVNKVEGVSQQQKDRFLHTYSMFAASAYISRKLADMAESKAKFNLPFKKEHFMMDKTRDQCLDSILYLYNSFLKVGHGKNILDESNAIVDVSYNFFSKALEELGNQKEEFDEKLTKLVETEFEVAGDFRLKGFTADIKKPSIEVKQFRHVEPKDVAGNSEAKTEMLRDTDRMALYDLRVQKNPIVEFNGLSFTVLYDGFPGTGKTTLMGMGYTNLDRKCLKVSDYWIHAGIGPMEWLMVIIDGQQKDRFYGGTGEKVRGQLNRLRMKDKLVIGQADDIDLTVSSREESQGGDDDFLNELMQFTGGQQTVILGNAQLWAATNEPLNLDPALRQRFHAKYAVTGPEEWYDYADIMHSKLRKFLDLGVVRVKDGKGYTPFQMRANRSVQKGGIMSSLFGGSKESGVTTDFTFRDLGEMCVKFKEENPRFTGRPIESVTMAIAKKINDYDIPGEYYTDPKVFLEKPYEEKVGMIRSLILARYPNGIDSSILAEELEKYHKNEMRYEEEKFTKDVDRRIYQRRVIEAADEAFANMRN
ncbi:AAA family ATPase [Candidatus Woesearchaeota archaeon]|nr:AAA family ATPase [Candidatus Woesearchaeota archaeon]